MAGCLGTSALIVLLVFCSSIGLLPPRVVARKSLATFTDMSGRGVDIARPPRNLAILAPVLSPYGAVAGNLNSVHAISWVAQRIDNNGAFHLVFPLLGVLPVWSFTGGGPDPELILHFGPDAVLVSSVQSDALRATGYPGLIELNADRERDDGKRLWDFFGKLQNQEGRATRLWQTAAAQRRLLRALMPRAMKPIRVLLMSSYRSDSIWIGRRGYFLDPLLQNLGAVRVNGGLGLSGYVGPEQILRYDPDIILVPSFIDTDDLSHIYGNPVWRALRAVRAKRVYLMPHTSEFNIPVDQTLLSFWLAEILHPTLPHMTRDAYRSVYADVYGRNLSDAEIDAILQLKKNGRSFDYARFEPAQ